MNELMKGRRISARGILAVAGATVAIAMLPVAANASSADGGGLVALLHQVQALAGQADSNTADIAGLKATVSEQSAQISALQSALAAESAARQTGDADTLSAARAYTDAETARAESAEQSVSGGVAAADDDTGLLAAANSYTDSQVSGEAAARSSADSSLSASLNAEAGRAQAVEGNLQAQLNNEIGRAKAAEQAAYTNAVNTSVGIVDANLTTLAQGSSSAYDFWQQIASGNLP